MFVDVGQQFEPFFGQGLFETEGVVEAPVEVGGLWVGWLVSSVRRLPLSCRDGLAGRIWTGDLLDPNQARYQTALRPDVEWLYVSVGGYDPGERGCGGRG